MHVARSLLLHGAHHGRIAVTDIADRNPGHEVEITLAFGRMKNEPSARATSTSIGDGEVWATCARNCLRRIILFYPFARIRARSAEAAYKSGTIPRRCKIASESFTLRRIQRQSVSACSASDIRQLPTVRRMRSESV